MSSIDPAALERLCELIGGDRGALRELVDTFLQEGGEILAELDAAVTGRDAMTLRRAAHSLKSSAEDFGAGDLADRAAALEARAVNGWPTDAIAEVGALQIVFQTAHDGLRDWLRVHG